MPTDYLDHPQIAKLSFLAIKRWLKTNGGAIPKKKIDEAGTKFALLNLAEEYKVNLDQLIESGSPVRPASPSPFHVNQSATPPKSASAGTPRSKGKTTPRGKSTPRSGSSTGTPRAKTASKPSPSLPLASPNVASPSDVQITDRQTRATRGFR